MSSCVDNQALKGAQKWTVFTRLSFSDKISRYREKQVVIYWENETSNRKYYKGGAVYHTKYNIQSEQLVIALSSWMAARSRIAGPNFKPKIRVKWDSVRTSRAEPSIECSWKTWKISKKDSLELSFSRGHHWFFWGGPTFFSVGDLFSL